MRCQELQATASEPLNADAPVVQRAARALVLTEWKIAGTAAEMQTKVKEAREQIKQYVGGVLGDTELTRTRYIVIVTTQALQPAPDESTDEITYRHIVVSLTPLTPSQSSKANTKRT
jgi:hypothetical protein